MLNSNSTDLISVNPIFPSQELSLESESTVTFDILTSTVYTSDIREAFDRLYLDLDVDQKAFVDQPHDILGAINANPGSGKTHALIARAIKLVLLDEIPAQEIVLITFTNKAARELKNRWDDFFFQNGSQDLPSPWISTLHRFGYNLLLTLTGVPYTVLTESRAQKLLRTLPVMEEVRQVLEPDVSSIQKAIETIVSANELHVFIWPQFNRDGSLVKIVDTSQPNTEFELFLQEHDNWSSSIIWSQILHKIRSSTPQAREDLRQHYSQMAGLTVEQFRRVLTQYFTTKYASRMLDYSDMLYAPYAYLVQHPDARPTATSRHTHFMIDETQDCSSLDLALISTLLTDNPKLVLTGDTKQTLYLWRGAVPHVLDNLDRLFSKPVYQGKLTRNYRSTQQLVALSNLFATRFDRRHLHESVPVKPAARNSLSILSFDTQTEENAWVARDIKEAFFKEGADFKYSDFVILARTNRSLLSMEAALIQNCIPYQIKTDSRGVSKSPGFAFLHAIYTLFLNPRDLSAVIVLAENTFGVGHKSIKALLHEGIRFLESNLEASIWDIPIFSSYPYLRIKAIHDKLLSYFYPMVTTTRIPALNAKIIEISRSIAYWGEMPGYDRATDRPLRFSLKWASFDKAIQLADLIYHLTYPDAITNPPDPKEAFLNVYQTLTVSKDTSELDESKERVILSTVHAFKGRQARRIYYIHLNRTRPLPPSEEDAERCAAYVAFTRAQEKLTLTASSSAPAPIYNSQIVPTYANPFLAEYVTHVRDFMEGLKKQGTPVGG